VSENTKRILYWAPRALSILFILFLSLFALDVIGAGYGFWGTLAGLAIHLIPSFVLIGALVLAWRWEWIGAAVYGGAAVLYISEVLPRSMPLTTKLTWILTIAGPALVVAVLFLANWRKRVELHRGRQTR